MIFTELIDIVSEKIMFSFETFTLGIAGIKIRVIFERNTGRRGPDAAILNIRVLPFVSHYNFMALFLPQVSPILFSQQILLPLLPLFSTFYVFS